MEYYENKDFNSDDVYDILRGTDKENELFDYATYLVIWNLIKILIMRKIKMILS